MRTLSPTMEHRALARRTPEHLLAGIMVGLGALCCFFGAFEVGLVVAASAALSVWVDV